MSHLKQADSKTQWFEDNYPGSSMHLGKNTMVAVLHTTEGFTWPSYSGGSLAPNYTGLPPIGLRLKGKWRVHFPDERSSRALENHAGGVETNTMNAVQFELIGTCDPAHRVSWAGKKAGKDYVYWPNANTRQKNFVAWILADMHIRHGLQLVAPKPFKAYPDSYGANNGVRMSFSEWHNAVGIVGHQHVPENVHGDPGHMDMAYIIKRARYYVARHK